MDDDLLPYRAAESVREVVDLIHDHETEAIQITRTRVEHVAQDLGGHDDDVRMRVD